MPNARPLVILVLLLASIPLAAGESPASPDPSPSVVPSTLPPFHPFTLPPSASAPSLLPDFELLTEKTLVEANVSDPSAVSVSFNVVVQNTGSLPLSVTLSGTINLGGTVALSPARTPLLVYGATASSVVSVTLPENTSSESVGYLQIDGAANEYPGVTQSLQVRVAVRQWHLVRIDRFIIDPASPLEGQIVSLGAHVVNAGNGPSNFSASVLLDGKPLELRINGQNAGANTTVLLGPGKFFMLGASWKARLGGHNFLLEASDIGGPGDTSPLGKDTRSAPVTVGYNFIDLLPYAYLTIFILVVAAVAGYRYRVQLAPRLRRLKRILKRGEPGSEGDEGDEEDEWDEGDEEDEGYEDDGEYDDDGEEEEARRPKKAVAPPPRRPAAPARRPPAPGAPAGKAPLKAGNAPLRAAKAPATGKPPANPPAGPGVILVGGPEPEAGPEERRAPPGKARTRAIQAGEEE